MAKGYSQSEIAREFGVSRQYVHKLAKDSGYEPVSTRVTELFPWEVDPEFYGNTIYQAMRLLGSYRLNQRGLSKSSLAKVRGFARKLARFNQVVDYDPAYPAVPGLSNTPGFAYVPRQPGDGDLIVRVRPGVVLSGEARRIWIIPEGLI